MNVDTGEIRELEEALEKGKTPQPSTALLKQLASQATIIGGMRRIPTPRAHKSSEPVRPDTPTKREVTWEIGQTIEDLNQCAIARAVLKRSKRALKAAQQRGDTKAIADWKMRCDAILYALTAHHSRPR